MSGDSGTSHEQAETEARRRELRRVAILFAVTSLVALVILMCAVWLVNVLSNVR